MGFPQLSSVRRIVVGTLFSYANIIWEEEFFYVVFLPPQDGVGLMIRFTDMPGDFHSGLTQERLSILAAKIKEARRKVSLKYDPDNGDDPWCQACRGFRWTCKAIRQLQDKHQWVEVNEKGLHFVFSIGGLSMRFYRGDPKKVPERYLKLTYPELRVQQTSLDFGGPESSVWRLAVEAGVSGEVTAITLVRLSPHGEVLNTWPIAAAQSDRNLTQFRSRQARRLNAPKITYRSI